LTWTGQVNVNTRKGVACACCFESLFHISAGTSGTKSCYKISTISWSGNAWSLQIKLTRKTTKAISCIDLAGWATKACGIILTWRTRCSTRSLLCFL